MGSLVCHKYSNLYDVISLAISRTTSDLHFSTEKKDVKVSF